MSSELNRAERDVQEHSVALKKPLGLRDLVLTQILFVVGSTWVGAAAKLGHAHLFFWLLAILFFYIPQAGVVIYLNRLMPLEGGIYQWAKLGFNWRRVDAEQQMVRLANQRGIGRRPRLGLRPRFVVR